MASAAIWLISITVGFSVFRHVTRYRDPMDEPVIRPGHKCSIKKF